MPWRAWSNVSESPDTAGIGLEVMIAVLMVDFFSLATEYLTENGTVSAAQHFRIWGSSFCLLLVSALFFNIRCLLGSLSKTASEVRSRDEKTRFFCFGEVLAPVLFKFSLDLDLALCNATLKNPPKWWESWWCPWSDGICGMHGDGKEVQYPHHKVRFLAS